MHAKQQSGCLPHSQWWYVQWEAWVRLTAALLHNRQKLSCKSCLLKTRLWMRLSWHNHLLSWFCVKAQLVSTPQMVLLSLPCVKWSGRHKLWNLLWKRMWERSLSPIPSWSGYRRWQQMRSVSSGLGEMTWRLRCEVLDVLGRSSLQSVANPSTAVQRWQEELQVECNQSCRLDGILDTTRELAAFSSWPLMEPWTLQGFEGWTRRVDEMLTVGMLFVVSLGMSLKGEQELQRLFKPHVFKLFFCLWRHVGAAS